MWNILAEGRCEGEGDEEQGHTNVVSIRSSVVCKCLYIYTFFAFYLVTHQTALVYLFFCLFDLEKNGILFYNICAIYNDQTAEFSPPNGGLLRESYPTGLNSGYIRIYKKLPSIEVFTAFGRWKLLLTWLLQVHFGHQDQGGLPPLPGQPMKSWKLHGEPPRSSGPPEPWKKRGPWVV